MNYLKTKKIAIIIFLFIISILNLSTYMFSKNILTTTFDFFKELFGFNGNSNQNINLRLNIYKDNVIFIIHNPKTIEILKLNENNVIVER